MCALPASVSDQWIGCCALAGAAAAQTTQNTATTCQPGDFAPRFPLRSPLADSQYLLARFARLGPLCSLIAVSNELRGLVQDCRAVQRPLVFQMRTGLLRL